jgi:hypothetical protein
VQASAEKKAGFGWPAFAAGITKQEEDRPCGLTSWEKGSTIEAEQGQSHRMRNDFYLISELA